MFTETREMLDATIYPNGRSELGAKNVNLAMHAMLDATEGQVVRIDEGIAATDVKITEIRNDLTKLGESGLGGLTFKFPIALMELLQPATPSDAYIDDEIIATIVAEFPTLAQPLAELMEHNRGVIAKINEALAEGKPMPIITIDISALSKEIAEAMGETEVAAIIGGANLYPTLLHSTNFNGYSYIVAMCSVANEGRFQLVFNDMGCGIVAAFYAASVEIPLIGQEPIEQSVDTLYALEQSGLYSDLLVMHSYHYGGADETQSAIVPINAKLSEMRTYLLLRFVVDAEIIEAVINLESGKTTSRVIARMTPEEVGVIAEGTLTRVNNLTYPYYEILPAEGNAVVSLNIKSTVPWTLYDGQTTLTSGEAGSKSYEYVVGANTLTEPLNHNYRLVATADGEELATLWIVQAAAPAPETNEQVTEE